jgi:DNA-binding HxlR family transcriptional regulator
MRTYKEFMECSVNRTIKLISGKWKPVILKQLAEGETRFVDIWRAIPKVSKKVLSVDIPGMLTT